jgi:CRP-like cAMP-binding protein
MYFLTKGRVEAVRGNPPQQLMVLREGAFFGELAILTDAPRAARSRPDREQVRDLLGQLAKIHLALAKGTNEHNARAQVAIRIAELSRPGVISARFDPETHAIAITFTPAEGS